MRYIDQTESSSSSSAAATPPSLPLNRKNSYQNIIMATTKFQIESVNSEVLPIVSKQNLKTINKSKIQLGTFINFNLKICLDASNIENNHRFELTYCDESYILDGKILIIIFVVN